MLLENSLQVNVHSDHGTDYSYKSFQEMLQKYHVIQSMSRVGNLFDNHEIEFWFSILKTELIYRLDIKKMSFAELKQPVADYIYYYNNVRIQKVELNDSNSIQKQLQ